MIRKIFITLCALLCTSVHAGPIANIEYIHALIKQRHGIDIEYSPELADPRLAANMKYLLSVVDIANTRLNRIKLTTYGENAQYATLNAADTDTVITAVDDLIVKIEYPFHFTPAVETNEYMFTITAAGTFYIDWGDGNVERVVKTSTGAQQIRHTYADAANNYTIGLGGRATGYSTTTTTVYEMSVVNFPTLSRIDGCLGCVFSTIGDGTAPGTQPYFFQAFARASTLTGEIPPNLFDGVHGPMVPVMFKNLFVNAQLTGTIPETLFAGIKGPAAFHGFDSTFYQCDKLTGEIPGNLFAGLTEGPDTTGLFERAFYGCRGLTGIGADLFSSTNIGVNTGQNIFAETFYNCIGLTGDIPSFSGIHGAPAYNMFNNTFFGCSNLAGPLPDNMFAGIQGPPAERMFYMTFQGCSNLTGEIPENLFSGIQGPPAPYMFVNTFVNCAKITGHIPDKLFAGITGPLAQDAFSSMFYNCRGLTGEIPEKLFAGIDTTASLQNGLFRTFMGCRGLSGPSARIDGEYLYNIWLHPTDDNSSLQTYYECTGLSDWADIPSNWK